MTVAHLGPPLPHLRLPSEDSVPCGIVNPAAARRVRGLYGAAHHLRPAHPVRHGETLGEPPRSHCKRLNFMESMP